jgi:hypothetical protein
MSALPSKADIPQHPASVGFVVYGEHHARGAPGTAL